MDLKRALEKRGDFIIQKSKVGHMEQVDFASSLAAKQTMESGDGLSHVTKTRKDETCWNNGKEDNNLKDGRRLSAMERFKAATHIQIQTDNLVENDNEEPLSTSSTDVSSSSSRSISSSQKGPVSKSKKRRRRTASEIDRKFHCDFPGCDKAYGSEGSLNQHILLKHSDRAVERSIAQSSGPSMATLLPASLPRVGIPFSPLRPHPASYLAYRRYSSPFPAQSIQSCPIPVVGPLDTPIVAPEPHFKSSLDQYLSQPMNDWHQEPMRLLGGSQKSTQAIPVSPAQTALSAMSISTTPKRPRACSDSWVQEYSDSRRLGSWMKDAESSSTVNQCGDMVTRRITPPATFSYTCNAHLPTKNHLDTMAPLSLSNFSSRPCPSLWGEEANFDDDRSDASTISTIDENAGLLSELEEMQFLFSSGQDDTSPASPQVAASRTQMSSLLSPIQFPNVDGSELKSDYLMRQASISLNPELELVPDMALESDLENFLHDCRKELDSSSPMFLPNTVSRGVGTTINTNMLNVRAQNESLNSSDSNYSLMSSSLNLEQMGLLDGKSEAKQRQGDQNSNDIDKLSSEEVLRHIPPLDEIPFML